MCGNMCSRIEHLELEVALQLQLHFETLSLLALKLVPPVLLRLEISLEHQCNSVRAFYSGTYNLVCAYNILNTVLVTTLSESALPPSRLGTSTSKE
jgi:hypothetical protein